MDKRNPYYVIETSPARWGMIAGDYATRPAALKGLAKWRKKNPDLPYAVYRSEVHTETESEEKRA